MFEVRLLPARQGDAIWIRWGTRVAHQMIVDMGTVQIGNAIRKRLAALEPNERMFELLVVTHIDADHIGGVLSCLVDSKKKVVDGPQFRDVWFNGLDHLESAEERTLEEQGGVQGKKLVDWLESQTWNSAFGGAPVCREGKPRTIALPGGMKVKVLGPTRERLAELAPVWRDEVRLALKKKQERESQSSLEELGAKKPRKPRLASRADLTRLAAKVTGTDPSKANGSSIVLLLEYGRHRVLLSGDAHAQDLVAGIRALGGSKPLRLDAFKLPHHGSRENTTKELIECVDCPAFLFSTDGTQFYHPHADAVACVIRSARRRPAGLFFNARSQYSGWWDNSTWASSFDYSATYGNDDEGLVMRFSR